MGLGFLGMARTYRLGRGRRIVNAAVKPLTRLGLAGRHTYLLRVPGRRSGRIYETPVTLVEDGERWLVAPYGAVAWVRNLRAAGECELQQRGEVQKVRAEEVGPELAGPVLKRYVKQVAVVRPYFDASSDAPEAEFAAEADRHPVFRITPASESAPPRTPPR